MDDDVGCCGWCGDSDDLRTIDGELLCCGCRVLLALVPQMEPIRK